VPALGGGYDHSFLFPLQRVQLGRQDIRNSDFGLKLRGF